jgi:hypothetical protein
MEIIPWFIVAAMGCVLVWAISSLVEAKASLGDEEEKRRNAEKVRDEWRDCWRKLSDEIENEKRERQEDARAFEAGATLQAILNDLRGGHRAVVRLMDTDYSILGVLDVPPNVTITWGNEAPNFFCFDRDGAVVEPYTTEAS